MKLMAPFMIALFAIALTGLAQAEPTLSNDGPESAVEELNPFAPDVEEVLKSFDNAYEQTEGVSSWLPEFFEAFALRSCYRQTCAVWAHVDKSSQRMYLYLNGNPVGTYAVSTGAAGHETPDFDQHPNGRVYYKYTSTKWPDGDYRGLGNMPYAVFISGGFAIHGTPEGNWRRLGRRASHGCIRVHPDNAAYFNSLVRRYGVRNVWITVD